MKPSQTTAGQRWLKNFDDYDAPAATLLIDSLRFVTLSGLRDGLFTTLLDLAATKTFESPAVVLPERSLRDQSADPVAYGNFDPGGDIDVTGGSEAFVGTVLRDLPGIRRLGADAEADWIPPSADLDELRERECRSIVVVTDYIGTGRQILTFIEALTRNKTIRSWRSYRMIKIFAVAFAASPSGLEHVRGARSVSGAWVVEPTATFEQAPWTQTERDAIVELCEAKCRLSPRFALGYNESRGLFVTERGAPNNLPAILWQEVGGWAPLFRERTVETDFARSVGDYRPGRDSLRGLAERVGQQRMGRNERLDNMRLKSSSILRALIQLNRGQRTPETLYAELAVDSREGEALLGFLRAMKFVEEDGKITQRGREEIAANKRGLRRTTAGIIGSDDPYYPFSLR